MAKLEARGIQKSFGGSGGYRLRALSGIDLAVEAGEFVCLVGPSGCGKSTFLRIVAGLEEPDAGQILFDGRPVEGTGPERIMVFQEGALFPWLTVGDNVSFGLKVNGVPAGERSQIVSRYLEMMQLGQFSGYYTHQLSTGMKQRVAIARALAMDPDVLLMDEPFAALDTQTRYTLIGEMQEIWARTKKTVIFVTHNVAESAALGSRVVVFGNRPSRIRQEFSIDKPRPRHAEDGSLADVQSAILAALRPEVQRQEDLDG